MIKADTPFALMLEMHAVRSRAYSAGISRNRCIDTPLALSPRVKSFDNYRRLNTFGAKQTQFRWRGLRFCKIASGMVCVCQLHRLA